MKDHKVFNSCLELLARKSQQELDLVQLYKRLGSTIRNFEDRALVRSLIPSLQKQKSFPLDSFCEFLKRCELHPQDPKLLRTMIDETEEPAQKETLYRLISKSPKGVFSLGEVRALYGLRCLYL